MKNFKVITYIILMIAFSFSFSSCEKHDDIHYHSDCDIISIMVRANSPEDGTTYDGVISENGNITFELPAKEIERIICNSQFACSSICLSFIDWC